MWLRHIGPGWTAGGTGDRGAGQLVGGPAQTHWVRPFYRADPLGKEIVNLSYQQYYY